MNQESGFLKITTTENKLKRLLITKNKFKNKAYEKEKV